MNESTLQKLEFEAIKETIADYCASGLGRRLADSITPTSKPHVVGEWLEQVRELLSLLDEHGFPPMAGIHDLNEEVRACRFPTPLEPEALARMAETLQATATLKGWLARVTQQKVPNLLTLDKRIHNFGELAAKINDAIDPRGEVRDYASDRLSAIRSTIRAARDRVRDVFDRLTRQSSVTKMLQYSGATFHSDRMVLPLKAEYRGRIEGIIHRSSDTGATLFVEPAESVELNNRIIRLRDEESKEVTRILKELCTLVSEESSDIITTMRAIGILDLVAAKCRYAKKRACQIPIIDERVLDLHEARHPLLIELFDEETKQSGSAREVVPIDVRLGDDFDVLAITGPNTGGKTVALKTVGLLALMTQSGIPIPVGEGSRICVFKDIFVDIGDEQSIQQSLSTFSSHLSNIIKILNKSDGGTLVLIDELGAGTDPDEGAAIGQAIILELVQLGARGIVTTHLSALKALAYNTARVDNGCVEFDPQSLRPTYKLRLGEPGNSNALIIAKRLGMPPRLVQTAKKHLDDRNRMLHEAIKGTLDSRREAERARKDARQAALKAQRIKEEFDEQREQLQNARKEFEEWTEWVNDLKKGDEVYVQSLRSNAKVVRVQLHKQKVTITSRTMDIEVPLSDIKEPQAGE